LTCFRLHGEGGVYDLYCSQPPGGDQNALDSLFKMCTSHLVMTMKKEH